MIRIANYVDIPRIIELLHECHARSIYAEKVKPNEDFAEGCLLSFLHNHGNPNAGGTFVIVSENKGAVEGVFAAVLEPICFNMDALSPRPLILYQSERARPLDAKYMLDAYVAWSEANPKVVDTRGDYADYVQVGADRIDRLYARAGFQKVGSHYRKER